MEIRERVAVITGAGSGIGQAVARQLASRHAGALALVDRSDIVVNLAESIEAQPEHATRAIPFIGDVTDARFRKSVFERMTAQFGPPQILVPAAGIARDGLAAKINKETGKAELYPVADFREVLEINLTAPVYWSLDLVAHIAEARFAKGIKGWNPNEGIQGVIVFIGSVSSQGNKGQIAYATTKAGLEGAAATLMKEAMFYGVRCGVIHPGFTDTPMVRALGEEYITKNILPYTQLGRLIRPDEIADAICFMISNSAVSGQLWADAGWHPSA